MATPILYVRNQIIARALRLAQISSDMGVMDDQKVIQAGDALATLLRAWQEKKVNLWAENWITFTLTVSSNVIGTDAKYYRCIKGHTSTSSSSPGVGSNWSTYWEQDDSATTSAVAWAAGTAYVTIAEISATDCYAIISSFVRDGKNEYDLRLADSLEFFKTSDHETLQLPTMLWFDNKTKVISLSPIPDTTNYVIHALVIRQLENLLIDGQPPDIPASYQDALVYCLAANLADENGLPIERCQYLRATGERYLAQVMSGPFQDKRKTQGLKSMYPRFK